MRRDGENAEREWDKLHELEVIGEVFDIPEPQTVPVPSIALCVPNPETIPLTGLVTRAPEPLCVPPPSALVAIPYKCPEHADNDVCKAMDFPNDVCSESDGYSTGE